MLFNSYPFLFLFLPVTLLLFFQLGRANPVFAAGFLAAASLFFYGWWSPAYVGLLLGSICFNYALGFWIAKAGVSGQALRKKRLLIFALAADLLLLGYCKYANFFLDNLNSLTGARWELGKVLLPLGISFFTFTQIAFLVDTYHGEVKEYSFVHYCLFVTYFPHLIAGPVLHHKEMMPQFQRPETYRLDYENVSVGLTIFFFGLFKKVILADGSAPYVAEVFGAPAANATLLSAWGGTLAYTLQIYFDFSGYSDMAIGLSRLFGITLPLNFHSPYKAVNIVEFWRRWHMTLSRFLRDYLYIPLGGNRHGILRRYLNLMTTMLLGGLWHGAGWTFVIWGGLHGAYLVVNHAWHAVRRALGQDLSLSTLRGRILGRLITFAAVVAAWVFFRAKTLDEALTVLKGMAGMNGVMLPERWLAHGPGLKAWALSGGARLGDAPGFGGDNEVYWIAGLLAIAWLLPNTQQIMADFKPALGVPRDDARGRIVWKPAWGWLLVAALVALKSITGMSEHVSEFLYYKF